MPTALAPAPEPPPADGDTVQVKADHYDPKYRGREGTVISVASCGGATLLAVQLDGGRRPVLFYAGEVVVTARAGAR